MFCHDGFQKLDIHLEPSFSAGNSGSICYFQDTQAETTLDWNLEASEVALDIIAASCSKGISVTKAVYTLSLIQKRET